jgi:uncharacterized membrane protein YphA (DoxX/SURF4 family)
MNLFLSLIALGLRLILGGVMMWAGISKIPDPLSFVKVVEAYDVLPLILTRPYAVALPWIEVLVGCCLVAGIWTRSNAVLLLLLLGSFAVALGVNLYRGTDMSCGCFGLEASGHSLGIALLGDVFLIAGAWPLLYLYQVDYLGIDYLISRRM